MGKKYLKFAIMINYTSVILDIILFNASLALEWFTIGN
jgi:hypothetical protein